MHCAPCYDPARPCVSPPSGRTAANEFSNLWNSFFFSTEVASTQFTELLQENDTVCRIRAARNSSSKAECVRETPQLKPRALIGVRTPPHQVPREVKALPEFVLARRTSINLRTGEQMPRNDVHDLRMFPCPSLFSFPVKLLVCR